jgi:iron complex outermembrane receptor protein
VLAASSTSLLAQDRKDLSNLSLEELMNVEVSTASKHSQKAEDAPSSVTVVTAEDIQHYGYRTLADVLRSVRGFYVNYDRNYSYVGVRGFAPPGDYNSRILLLLDGQRLNDNVYDEALIGTELPVALDAVERIEIVRGPSSSLYGADAFFGVINIITKSRDTLNHGQVSTEIGSFGSYKGSFTIADTLSRKVSMLLSGSIYESKGPTRLYFPEFNSPATNNGFALNVDDDASRDFLARLAFGDFTLESAIGTREKGIPTGSYETVFNDPRNRTTDSEGNLVLTFDHKLDDTASIMARASYNRYNYSGYYIYSGAGISDTSFLDRDFARGDWCGLEGQLRKQFFRKHEVTFGAEYRDNLHQDQTTYDVSPYVLRLDIRRDSMISAGYIQDEFRIHPRLTLNAGVRYDHYSTFGGSTNPRLGLMFRAAKRTTVKLLYGQAFRPPSVYELYYGDGISSRANPLLQPETIRTSEAVVEQYLGEHFQLSASGYFNQIHSLIRQRVEPLSGLLVFENAEKVHARGLEFEARARWPWLDTRLSYAIQKAADAQTGVAIINSPRHLAQANVLVPFWKDRFMFGAEGQYMSTRKTIQGGQVSGFGMINLTLLSRKLISGLDVSCTAYNLLDKRFSNPGGPELIQNSIPQDGRSLRVKFSYSF